MSIEQSIADVLAKHKLNEATNVVTKNAVAGEPSHLDGKTYEQNPDNARNNVDNQDAACNAVTKKPNRVTVGAGAGEPSHLPVKSVTEETDENFDESEIDDILESSQLDELSKNTLKNYIKKSKENRGDFKDALNYSDDAKEKEWMNRSIKNRSKGVSRATSKLNKEDLDVSADVDALFNGETLSEEFKDKATTIFEAAVVTRVKAELESIEEDYEELFQEAILESQEALEEQVNDYLDFVVEQFLEKNQIAIARGLKTDILEGFVSGLKGLFEEHYIDIPDEKFDVLGSLEEDVKSLEEKLNEQMNINIELNKSLNEMHRNDIVNQYADGLTDTEVEKFVDLTEELNHSDINVFETKVKTIRENYFSTKTPAGVDSVVTDTPVGVLTEDKKVEVDPAMAARLAYLNK